MGTRSTKVRNVVVVGVLGCALAGCSAGNDDTLVQAQAPAQQKTADQTTMPESMLRESFAIPQGYKLTRTEFLPQLGDTGLSALTYSMEVPDDPKKGVLGSHINITIADGIPNEAASKASDAERATAMTGNTTFAEEPVGGRSAAVARRSEVVSGAEFGLPDRVTNAFYFTDGGLLVQIHAQDAKDSAVDEIVASFDAGRAAAAINTNREGAR